MINLNLTIEEVNLCLQALGDLPMKVAEGAVNKIRLQAIPQAQELQKQAEEAKKAEEKPE